MIELGQEVRDRLSRFGGIVTTVEYRTDNCRYVGVSSDIHEEEVTEKFFHCERIDVVEKATELTSIEDNTEYKYGIGCFLEDEASLFEGICTKVRTNLFTEPEYLITEQNPDGEPAEYWVYESMIVEHRAVCMDLGTDFHE